LGRINAIGNRHEESRRPNRILGIATNHTQIGDHFSLGRRGYTRADLLDNAYDLIARRKRQRSLEVRISSTPDHRVRKAGTGRNHLDADLPGTGLWDGLLFHDFQYVGPAEPGDTNVSPSH
jgi:hypothetical protein